MAEIVGVDHVSVGTDQFDARGCVEDYTRWVELVAAMLLGGFTPEEAGRSPAATICASSVLQSAEGLQANAAGYRTLMLIRRCPRHGGGLKVSRR